MSSKLKLVLLLFISISLIGIGVFLNLDTFSTGKAASHQDQTKEKAKIQDPKFELIQDEVTIQKGSSIEYLDYIRAAEDEYGYNIKYKVKTPEKIDTNVDGKYQITYRLVLGDGKEIMRKLIINVA